VSRHEPRYWKDPQYVAWRKAVYKRDRMRCLLCKKHTRGKPEAHHIRTWNSCSERRFDVTNGVTLCKPCHHRVKGHETEYQALFDSLANSGSMNAAVRLLMMRQEAADGEEE
jgi:5-methylcytosine-specific restriction endonuclease McrA